MEMQMLAWNFVCMVIGVGVGIFISAILSMNKFSKMQDELYIATKYRDEWHNNWRKVNNHLDAVRQACRKIYVPKRGKGGKITGKMPVWDLVEKAARDV